jgi:hypothetical protein
VSILLIAAAILMSRSWSSSETPVATPTSTPVTKTPPATVVAPAPAEPARSPEASVRGSISQSPTKPADPNRGATTSVRPASSGVSLVTAQLCGTFSPSGGKWRCDPPADPVPLGRIVLYTRVKASREATIEHRWYCDDALQRAVTLAIGANASEGYRTFSRQTVNRAGIWRVEVRNANGDLLHEEQFAVR